MTPSVFMACPVYDKPHSSFASSVHRYQVANPNASYNWLRTAEVCVGRGLLATKFLNGKYEWFLSLDCDMQFDVEDVNRLIGRGMLFIGNLYHKTILNSPETPRECLNTLDGKPFVASPFPQKVASTGTGFLLIHRSAMEQIRDANPQLAYTFEGKFKAHHLFPTGVYDGVLYSCDWAICKLWRDLGGEVYIDSTKKLIHFGDEPH